MAGKTSDGKVLSLADVKQLAEDKSKCILVINNRVYDITTFIDEHPGGEEVLKEQHGLDASNAFEDVGHSNDAREQMKGYEIGVLQEVDTKKPVKARPLIENASTVRSSTESSAFQIKWIIPIVIIIIAIVYFRLTANSNVDANRPPKAI